MLSSFLVGMSRSVPQTGQKSKEPILWAREDDALAADMV